MFRAMKLFSILIALVLQGATLVSSEESSAKLLPIPDRLVVLTVDDGTKTDITEVAPVLKRYHFGASFYITEGLREIRGTDGALTWDDIRNLNADGFEIGNHTMNHLDMTKLSREQIEKEIQGIEVLFKEHGIPAPKTFVYPGFHDNLLIAQVLLQKGYLFARRGVTPEFPDNDHGARGPIYDPEKEYPLLIPTTGYAGPQWGFKDLVWAVAQARNGKIAVLNFHGVPYPRAPWVSVDPKDFEGYIKYLHDQHCTVISMRDLAKYVAPAPQTKIPLHREQGKWDSGRLIHLDANGNAHP
jgi:peptidoglycan/xylan/chitin deacetylase (PgdA/CDA1 family)